VKQGAVSSRTVVAAVLAASGLAALGCPGAPRVVVYDLAARAAVAETWSGQDVLRFGTPAAEPRLTEGFHREAGGADEPFLWSKGECEVAFRWDSVEPRVAILDAMPYKGAPGQSVELRLNGAPVGRFALNDVRHRYRIELPAANQKAGDNRLRFTFATSGSPADADPQSGDKRQLAAAFYSLVTGAGSDASLDDLLLRDAPRPFVTATDNGVPSQTFVGPAVIRFALKLPPRAELRFTPELLAGARAAAGAASFRVLFEDDSGRERELLSLSVTARDGAPGEQVVRLPGRAGEIVRLGLAIGGSTERPRFAWARLVAPRVLGEGGGESLEARAAPAASDPRTEALRASLAGSNVLFVILDAARARSFGAYGYGRETTPEIDRLASEGVVFERVYTPAVYTLGAMSSIWTSQYPDRHHSEVSYSARLPKDRLTLAELLGAQGVHSAGFVANAVAGTLFGFDRGFSEFHEVFRTEHGSRGDVFRRLLPAWLEKNRDRRFFAYVHFREPHFPYNPQPPFDTRFGPEGPLSQAARADRAFFHDVNQSRRPFSEAEREHLVRLYDGNLAFADQEVGALVGELSKQGLLERTVVIVAADHGEELFEHGWIGHNVHLYEPSVRVPLVIRFPQAAGVAGGRRIAGLSDLLDLAPTIADVFGVLGKGGSEREFQGWSLLPAVAGSARAKPAVLSRSVWDRPRYALRDERFKLHYDTRSGEERLFDLEADPEERQDLAPVQPLRAAYYRQALHAWTLELARRARGGGDREATLTCEQCENLRSLGYIQGDCSKYCK
jgi:arylsulfatase A-like enzyme